MRISRQEGNWGFGSVNRSLVRGVATAVAGGLVFCIPVAAQNPPPAAKAKHVEILKGPALETSHDDIAIVRWTTNNPGGDDDHYSVIHYGTDPNDLSQTAKNHIRLNQSHPETVFRVRMQPLKPDTTYYYKVTSMGYDGVSDGVESSVHQFTTAAPGQQTSAHPLPE
jgi:phosphodiesterase/alkaline phosphatase D-like protein